MVFVLHDLPVPRSCFGGESKCLSWWKIKAYTGAAQGWLPEQESCRGPFFSVFGSTQCGTPAKAQANSPARLYSGFSGHLAVRKPVH